MKKVLFATTALVATAGVAAADVTFSGYGRFGVIYADNEGGDDETSITSRLRLQIDATAESDAGVVFGARARIQQSERGELLGVREALSDNGGTGGGTGINGVRFFARSGGLEVGVGNIFGALEYMPGQYPIDLGLTGLGYDYTTYNFRGDLYSSSGAGSAGDNGVEVLYSFGDWSFHVSGSDSNDRIAGWAAYNWNGFTFALAGQDSDLESDTDWAASVSGSFGVADVALAYASNGDDEDNGNGDHVALTATFDVGAATSLDLYVADADYFEETSYGIGVHHDLGGGTSIRGGVASRGNEQVRADRSEEHTSELQSHV